MIRQVFKFVKIRSQELLNRTEKILFHHESKKFHNTLGIITILLVAATLAVVLTKHTEAAVLQSNEKTSTEASVSLKNTVFSPSQAESTSSLSSGNISKLIVGSSLKPSPATPPQSTPEPTPAPSPTPAPDPTLKKDDENERVQQLQERLMDLNYMDLDEATLLYGPATQYAVQLFQRQHALPQDGIAGPKTQELLYSDEAKKYTLLEGTAGSDVDSLQRQLIDLGYLDTATGYYGTETVTAVTAFQERNGLSADGRTGEQTLALIYSPNALESAAKEQAETRSTNIQTFLDAAEEQLGDPYIFGNVGPDSFDCSGLIYYCLTQAGSSLGRYNADGYSQVDDWEKITSMDDLQKGDLLFFSTNGKRVGHTGIYIGNGEMIDASSSNGKVVKRSCVSSFWESNFVVARRPM